MWTIAVPCWGEASRPLGDSRHFREGADLTWPQRAEFAAHDREFDQARPEVEIRV